MIDDIYELINSHLEIVYSQAIGKNNFFSNKKEKDRYESFLNHSFRCLKASCYHQKAILAHKSELVEWANEMKKNVSFGNMKGQSSLKMNKNVDHFAFELFAFVASLKSSIDFLLTATHYHLMFEKCERALGIGDIERFLDNPKKDKKIQVAQIYEMRKWLNYLNNYRNSLLHRSSLMIKAGFEYRVIDEIQGTEIFPVTIPIEPQDFILDTREMRAYTFGDNHHLDKTESKVEITSADGKKTILRHEVKYKPSMFEIEVEDFMAEQLLFYKKFVKTYIENITFY